MPPCFLMCSTFWSGCTVKAFSSSWGFSQKERSSAQECLRTVSGAETVSSFLMLWFRKWSGWHQLAQEKDAPRFGENLPKIYCNDHTAYPLCTPCWVLEKHPQSGTTVTTDRHTTLMKPPTALWCLLQDSLNVTPSPECPLSLPKIAKMILTSALCFLTCKAKSFRKFWQNLIYVISSLHQWPWGFQKRKKQILCLPMKTPNFSIVLLTY